jgi:molybdopterin biosynthesis enzyme
MVLADALAVLPADKTSFAAGETVEVFLLGETLR